jgi:CubicO group peptidase (beta-lactamase class C family)
MLKARVEDGRATGLVLGVMDADGSTRVVTYGDAGPGAKPLDANSVFEIGSISKVFTSTLLADMAAKGEVKLDVPAQTYAPAGMVLPQRGEKQITLLNLSEQNSGLPRMPTNFTPKDPANPYADYTVDQMYQFLSGYTLTRDPGEKFEYSNLGGGLLGHVLALRAGTDYESLVRQRITAKLGMKDTAITLSPAMAGRLAMGHDTNLNPVKNWDLPTLAGAGALRSTTNDLLTFLAAELGFKPTALKDAMAEQVVVRRPTDQPASTGGPQMSVALGWIVRKDATSTVIWHNGGTGGYRTFIGFNPATRTGVVVLSNAATQAGPDDIGFHLLTGSKLAEPPKQRTEIALDHAAKEALAGQYQLRPDFILTVTLEGDQLFGQATGQPKFPLFAESPTQLFLKVVNAQMTFTMGPDGHAASMVLHQNGRDMPAPRMP